MRKNRRFASNYGFFLENSSNYAGCFNIAEVSRRFFVLFYRKSMKRYAFSRNI